MKGVFRFLLLLLFVPISGFAQSSTPTPIQTENDEVIKISTQLIQLDVTVTDKNNNIVTDLKPEDFEVYENGKKQNITNFSFIGIAPQPKLNEKDQTKAEKNSIPLPSVPFKTTQIKRTYALVVDDLGLSFENVSWVRQSLRKFVDEQMREGDLVAILRTGAGIGALQSFTADKRQLYAAIEKIKWNSYGRGGISSFPPFEETMQEQNSSLRTLKRSGNSVEDIAIERQFLGQNEKYRNRNFTVGTLGALSYIIRGMRELPGRKSVLVFSEGFQLQDPEIFDGMRVLADLANRSSATIYTLDPRGLINPEFLAAGDQVSDVFRATATQQERRDSFRDSQMSLNYLAEQTGGFAFMNQNDLNLGIRRAINDQESYYLLGYQPDDETFDPQKAKFNKIEIKVLRPDLKIRYHNGFYSISDEQLKKVELTPRQKMIAAVSSPFAQNEINLNLYPIFQNDQTSGNVIDVLVHIDAKDLTFKDENGQKKINFDLIAMTFGDNGMQIDQLSKNYSLEIGEKTYQNMLVNGFVYTMSVPIKKPSAYQVRIALRDTPTNRIGSASYFIEVPSVKQELSFSGIILDNFTIEEWQKIKSGKIAETNERSAPLDSTLRQFKKGSVLRYDYAIYNFKSERSIFTQTRLIKDGKVVNESPFTLFDFTGQEDLSRLTASGALTLGKNLTAGNYVLQIIATNKNPNEKPKVITQFIDFEVID